MPRSAGIGWGARIGLAPRVTQLVLCYLLARACQWHVDGKIKDLLAAVSYVARGCEVLMSNWKDLDQRSGIWSLFV